MVYGFNSPLVNYRSIIHAGTQLLTIYVSEWIQQISRVKKKERQLGRHLQSPSLSGEVAAALTQTSIGSVAVAMLTIPLFSLFVDLKLVQGILERWNTLEPKGKYLGAVNSSCVDEEKWAKRRQARGADAVTIAGISPSWWLSSNAS
eukprot:Gb_10674 [translate_table: standard]